MKILVTGYNGQLGFDVVKELQKRNIECKGVDRDDFDITNAEAVSNYINAYNPDAVVHCAAYTAVDKAEDEPDICKKVNVTGSENIAKVCANNDIKMVYISSDYVFGGAGCEPFETDAPICPCNVYGESKADGEKVVASLCKKHFIIRTSWVFGQNGGNFVKTMLRLARTHSELSVVDDQIGSPTYTPDLAVLICDMVVSDKYGVYHATNENYCSWAQFAAEIMRLKNKNVRINPVTTAEYGAKALRPLNSRLSKKSLDEAGFSRLPTWQDALKRYLAIL